MIQIDIIRSSDGIVTHSATKSSIAEVNSWIAEQEAKISLPWGEKSSYEIRMTDLDKDASYLVKAKKQAIKLVKTLSLAELEDLGYDSIDIAIIDARAITAINKAIEKGKTTDILPAAFVNMDSDLSTILAKRSDCIAAIKACTTLADLRLIKYNDVYVFKDRGVMSATGTGM